MFDPSLEQNVDPENVVNSRYFDIDEIETLKVHKKNQVSIFMYLFKWMLTEQCFWWSGVSTEMYKQIFWYNCSEGARISKKTSLTCNINLKTIHLNQTQQNPQQVELFPILLVFFHINHAATLTFLKKSSRILVHVNNTKTANIVVGCIVLIWML